MSASLTAGWENFFVAEVGAAAGLSGLLFVAVSINLKRILEISPLPARAAETLVLLGGVLAVATCGLVPGQSNVTFGVEVAATGAAVWTWTVVAQIRAYQFVEHRKWLGQRVFFSQIAAAPFLVGGVLVAAGHETGMYWLVPGVLASFGSGLMNAWVLLVEILR